MQINWRQEYHFSSYDDIDSTNNEAKRIIAQGHSGHYVLLAKSQHAGRGRAGRQWDSPNGNVYMSILRQESLTWEEAAHLIYITAVAVADAVAAVLPVSEPVSVKWPNDILLKGKKVAGILLEGKTMANQPFLPWAIIGIGINVRHFPEQTTFPATSLYDQGVVYVELERLFHYVMDHFSSWYAVWRQHGFEPIRLAWLHRALKRGEVITVVTPERKISGIFVDITEHGNLRVELANGQQTEIYSGEVFFSRGT
jgi:BirA family biotin operon repressor/biotin-[acetyl-CoA-carboxylase] ligase